MIQIVYSNIKLFSNIDLSYVKAYFNGDEVFCSLSFVESLSKLSINVKKNDVCRIRKAWDKGLSFRNKVDICFTKLSNNDEKRLYEKYFYYTDENINEKKTNKLIKK